MNCGGQLTHAPFEVSNHEFSGQERQLLEVASQKFGAKHWIHLLSELMYGLSEGHTHLRIVGSTINVYGQQVS